MRAAGDVGRQSIRLEARTEPFGRSGDDRLQRLLAQGQNVDLDVRIVERRILLQLAEEVGPQAHQREQPRIGEALRHHRGEAAALAFLRPDIEFLALVDVEQIAGGRLQSGPAQVAVGLVEQAREAVPAGEEARHPGGLERLAVGIAPGEVPLLEEALDQTLERRRARAHGQHAETAAAGETRRPGGAGDAVRPGLPLERGKHASLGDGGLADAGIAEQHRHLVGVPGKRGEYLDRLGLAAEEVVAVGFRHREQAAIGRGVPPQFVRPARMARDRGHEPANRLFRGGIRRDDPVQLPQERQAGGRLAVEQNEDDR